MLTLLISSLLCGITAVRTHQPPLVDGFLDDPCWAEAPVFSGHFTAFRPRVDAPMSEATDVRVIYDDTSIYFGFHMHDADPRGIPRPVGSRDTDFPTDRIMIYLDTFRDHSNCFVFSVSIGGVQIDSRRTAIGGDDWDWDAVWSSAVAVNDSGWTAEVAVPFSVLRYPPAPVQTWGVNFGRTISRSNEGGYMFRMRERGGMDVSLFGELTGLENLPRVSRMEWRPFAAGRHRFNNNEPWRDNLWGSAGFDLKVPLSMHAVVDVSVNPDFGQVESDADQGSISHWAPWLSEKRPFFMEGTDIFDMPFSMFYSRSIGSVAWNGEVIPILGGVKLTGVDGGTRYGFLGVASGRVWEDTTLAEPAASWAAGSVLHEFGPGNWIKFSGTSADAPGQEGNEYDFGRSAAFSGKVEPIGGVQVQGRLGLTWNRFQENEDNSAVRIDAGYFPENFEVNFRYQRKGEGFDPSRMGYNQAAGETVWSVYTGGSGSFGEGFIQSAWFGALPYYSVDARGRNAGSGVDAWVGAVSVARYDLNLNFGCTDRWFDRYEGPEGRWYPGGLSFGVSASSDYRKPLAGWISVNRTAYLDGHTRRFGVGLRLRPVPELLVGIEPSLRLQGAATRYNRGSGEWDRIETDWRSLNLSATYMITNLMRLRLSGQASRFERIWESEPDPQVNSRVWANILYSWEYLPGSWFHFLVGEDGEIGREPVITLYAKLSRFF